MLLKAGTYRFNNELNFDTIPFEYIEMFGAYSYEQDVNYQLTEVIDSFSNEATFQTFSFVNYPIENGYLTIFQYSQSIDLGATSNNVLNAYTSEVGWNGEEYEVPIEKIQTHTLTQDTEVADVFGEWYISSTNYNEVNPTEDKEYIEKSSWYTSVANAIRSKKGTSAPILRDNFASEISSISVGGETPYYDGTVIIEKAESVLGLRRFKDTVEPIASVEVDFTDDEQFDRLYEQYGFEIEPITVDTGKILGVSCVIYETSNSMQAVMLKEYKNSDGETIVSATTYGEFLSRGWDIYITKTFNTTVDEWLLANTEGVSV